MHIYRIARIQIVWAVFSTHLFQYFFAIDNSWMNCFAYDYRRNVDVRAGYKYMDKTEVNKYAYMYVDNIISRVFLNAYSQSGREGRGVVLRVRIRLRLKTSCSTSYYCTSEQMTCDCRWMFCFHEPTDLRVPRTRCEHVTSSCRCHMKLVMKHQLSHTDYCLVQNIPLLRLADAENLYITAKLSITYFQ